MDGLTLDEHRAVLCTHMLTYVLDGSVSLSELGLWGRALKRVEELYQVSTHSGDSLTAHHAALSSRRKLLPKEENSQQHTTATEHFWFCLAGRWSERSSRP
jgi:hypothetical protein